MTASIPPRTRCNPGASDRLVTIAGIALDAGALTREKLRSYRIAEVKQKGPRDYQTETDVASERLIAEAVHKHFPDYAIEGEEKVSNREAEAGAPLVHIDPIDGTTNFTWGIPHYGIVISIEEQGEITTGAVYDPMQDELFTAERDCGAWLNGQRITVPVVADPVESLIGVGLPVPGQVKSVGVETYHRALRRLMDTTSGVRRLGSAALSIAYVACGRLNGFFEDGLSPHDYGASVLLVREAGGVVTGFDGRPVGPSGAILAAGPGLHDWLVEGFKG